MRAAGLPLGRSPSDHGRGRHVGSAGGRAPWRRGLRRRPSGGWEQFAALVAMALASAQAHDELAASRRRIVEAATPSGGRLERNLHDGAQQRLVGLRMGCASRSGSSATRPTRRTSCSRRRRRSSPEAIADLRELAQGIHPAMLTDRGLGEASCARRAQRRSGLPRPLALPRRLPDAVEGRASTAYYVVSEGASRTWSTLRGEARRGVAGTGTEREAPRSR